VVPVSTLRDFLDHVESFRPSLTWV
jgi:hypothetical protein